MKKENGQALVEFIIILPILIILLLGTIDFCLMTYKKNLLENTVEGAVHVLNKTNDRLEVEKYLQKSNQNLKYSWQEESNYLTLEVSENYEFLTPGLQYIFPTSYKIKTKRVMYYE